MATIRGVTRRTTTGTSKTRLRTWPIAALPDEMAVRWEELLEHPGTLNSPFYHPAYVKAVGEVRSGIEVCVIERGGEPVGFVPFERSRLDVGHSIGRRLCDLSGAVVEPGLEWNATEVAKAARLRMLRLRHVPAEDTHHGSLDHFVEAPVMDLADGFEAWRRNSLDSGSRFVKQIERRHRKIVRQMGPLRLVWHTTDADVFEELLEWKAAQRDATNSPNVLLLPWARALVERLRTFRVDGFEGVLSALYAGDTLCAAHFGIRTHRVLHYWVPAYNVDLSPYSPGLLALTEIARAAAERGIERIDFGPGEERFKMRASTEVMRLATLTAATGPATRAVIGAADRARAWARASSAGATLRGTVRAVTRGAFALRSTVLRG